MLGSERPERMVRVVFHDVICDWAALLPALGTRLDIYDGHSTPPGSL